MMQIRPVSDLRNNFADIEKTVQNGAPVYLTKNGYGTMVVMSLEQYSALTNSTELALDEADRQAEMTDLRLTHDEVFGRLRKRSHEKV